MKTSWYREPWAWFVFILPFTAVVAGIATFIIANTDPDPLVVGDYYKKGKAINLELGKVKQAQKLGMSFGLKLVDDQLTIRPTGIEKTFPLLNVNFFHPTITHYFEADQNVTGKWRVTISPFENHWKIQNVITLPQSDFIAIKPDLTVAN